MRMTIRSSNSSIQSQVWASKLFFGIAMLVHSPTLAFKISVLAFIKNIRWNGIFEFSEMHSNSETKFGKTALVLVIRMLTRL